MKRLIAKRKLKHKCICGQEFLKGDVYYKTRTVYETDWGIYKPEWKIQAFEIIECSRCVYKKAQHNIRFKLFQEKCTHPEEFIETVWDYINGECVKEPQYDQCRLCNQILY